MADPCWLRAIGHRGAIGRDLRHLFVSLDAGGTAVGGLDSPDKLFHRETSNHDKNLSSYIPGSLRHYIRVAGIGMPVAVRA